MYKTRSQLASTSGVVIDHTDGLRQASLLTWKFAEDVRIELIGPVCLVLQRMGYGDVAWDQLFESKFWKSITGRTEETADFISGGFKRRKD